MSSHVVSHGYSNKEGGPLPDRFLKRATALTLHEPWMKQLWASLTALLAWQRHLHKIWTWNLEGG